MINNNKEKVLNSQITLDNLAEMTQVADLKTLSNMTDTEIGCDFASYWSPRSGSNVCPKCGSHTIEVNDYAVLTSNPPQAQLRCKDCGHIFGSGAFNSDRTNTIDPSSTLQLGDWWRDQQEPPSYPDTYIPRKDSPVGWICPKCGRCYAPHVRECSHCNVSEIKITY